MLPKAEHYCKAVERLREALTALSRQPDHTVIRDGVIQRFAFTFELAWKSLKEYLEDQGVQLALVSPRSVLKEAYAAGILHSPDAWNSALDARNRMSHLYDEAAAEEIARQISALFLPRLAALADFYREHQPSGL